MNAKSAAVVLMLLVAHGVCGAAYPERPIRLIVPAAPGGAIDDLLAGHIR